MKKALIILLIFGFSVNVLAQNQDSLIINIDKPIKLPIWTIPIPGASYYYQKKYIEGTIFATLEIGLIYLGLKYDDDLVTAASDDEGKLKTPYYNYPKNIGLQVFYLEKLANMKNHLENVKYRNPDFKYHDISEKKLYLAPFKKENVFTPVTGVMVFLAGATLTANYFMGETNGSPTVSDIDRLSFGDSYLPRNQALSYYLPVGFVQGWGAGITEEYAFRNWLMPLIDFNYGQRKGLIFSSLAFGVYHFQNYFKVDTREMKNIAIAQAFTTSLAGLVYGWDVQRRDYNIGPSVAAHAWFDMIIMVGSFLINPENNYLGVNLKLNL